MNIKALLILLVIPLSASAQNLIINGTFDAPEGPLHGWMTDYAWTRNTHYMQNVGRVRPVEQFAGQRNVVRFTPFGDAGSKMESSLIPFEQGAKYRATMKVHGGRFRIYFAGYQWTPGIRPHSEPTHQEMRQVYRSKALDSQTPGWRTITIDIPGVDASDLSMQHLRRVRFITLYMWFFGEGYVDDVVVTRVD